MRWCDIFESVSQMEILRSSLLDIVIPMFQQGITKIKVSKIFDLLAKNPETKGLSLDVNFIETLVYDDPMGRFSQVIDPEAIRPDPDEPNEPITLFFRKMQNFTNEIDPSENDGPEIDNDKLMKVQKKKQKKFNDLVQNQINKSFDQ